jgi:hypothetical protein
MPSKKIAKSAGASVSDVSPLATDNTITKDDIVAKESPSSPVKKHRRGSSSVTDVMKPDELSMFSMKYRLFCY